LSKLGIEVTFVDGDDPDAFKKALKPNTKLIYGETIGNPKLNIFPVEEVAKVAQEAQIPLVLDNTVLTPILHRPIEWGANVVVHSATKYIGGHGNSIAGVVVDGGNFDWSSGKFPEFTDPDPSYHGLKFWDSFKAFPPLGDANVAYILKMRLQYLRDMGAALSPSNAFLLLQGLETLHLRMERHCENAMKLAEYLENHDKVSWVVYPGLKSSPYRDLANKYCDGKYGALVGFGVKGGMEAGKKFIESVKLFSHLANLGDAKSLAIHPASTTHSQLTEEELERSGVGQDYIRLSIGIEDFEDIEADVEQALAQI